MQAVVGAILILAGSVLVASGIIVHGTHSIARGPAWAGYYLGGSVFVMGLAVLLAEPLKSFWVWLKFLWDSIPVDEPKPKSRE